MANKTKAIAFYFLRNSGNSSFTDLLTESRRLVSSYVEEHFELIDELFANDFSRTVMLHKLKVAVRDARAQNATLLIPYLTSIVSRNEIAAIAAGVNVDTIFLSLSHQGIENIDACSAVARQDHKTHGEQSARAHITDIQKTGVKKASEVAKLHRKGAYPLIEHLRQQGKSLREIAHQLNEKGMPTARGRSWHASSVRNVLKKERDYPLDLRNPNTHI